MSSEGIKSQQKFLQARGLYHGAIDGEWGNASIDAMKGWAYRSDSGNLDGSPFKNAPDGYVLVEDRLERAPEEQAVVGDAPAKKKAKKPAKKVTKAVVAKVTPTPTSCDGRKSFTVTGRDGDKPQPIVKKDESKAVKKAAKVVKKAVTKAKPKTSK